MNRTVAARGVFISLAVVAIGLAALVWWLIASGRFEGFGAQSASKTPAGQSEPRVSAPSPEKPASTAITAANEALKDLGDRLGPSTPASTSPAPAFDVARVEPNGEAVIAGRAVAGSSVELLVDGRVHDRTTADSSGAFVFVPRPLPPGNYDVTLRATMPDGKVTVSQSAVAVSLSTKDQPAVAALATPKAPPAVAAAPQSPPALEPSRRKDELASKPVSKDAELRIESVEPEEGGGVFVSGRATPGSRVRLYMNDGHIAMGTASPEGRVSFSIRSGVRAGDYRIRLDQMNASDGVVSRVEVPFRAPAATTLASPAPSASPQTPRSPVAPESVVASRQPEREPVASIASPSQPPVVAGEKSAPPAATSSQPSPSQAAAPGPAPKDLAKEHAKETSPRSTGPALPSPSPVANAQQSKSQAASESIQAATTPDAPASRPSTQLPVLAAPGSDPRTDNNASPRIAGRTSDRRDAVVIPSIDTRLIVRGDNLWRISEATYGLGKRYTVIFGANRDKIRDPDLIYPGQIFVLPRSGPKQ
jgi:nucleoid-associated protein YgaU